MARQRNINDTVAWLRTANDPNQIAGAAFLVSRDLAISCAHVIRDHLGLEKPTPRQLPSQMIRLDFIGLHCQREARVAPSGWYPDGAGDEIDDVAILEFLEPVDDALFHVFAPGMPTADQNCEVYGATGRFPPVGLTVKGELTGDPNARGWQQLDGRAGHESSYFVKPGFSGSPVRDPLTKATWGMVTAVLEEPDRMAFAIPAEILRAATDAVTLAARQRHQVIAPPAQRAPGPLDQLAREALASLLGEQMPQGDIEPERIEDLRRALEDLAERARKTTARSSIEDALERLKQGEKGNAETIFSKIVADKQAEGAAALREAAEAARHLGALASLDNTAKAIEAYATASRLDPDDTWSWIFLGRLYAQAGDLAAAEQAFLRAQEAAKAAGDERDVMVVHNELGDVQTRGALAAALANYEAGLAIAEKLAAQDPGNAEWQRDLSVSFIKIGDVQRARGDLEGALTAYQDSLGIAEKLAAQDPGNAEWQRDLSVSFNKIGDVQRARGDLEGALTAYQDSLGIAEKLAAQDPGNAQWQRDLSVSFNKIGDVQRARGDLEGALTAYQDSLGIAEKLAAQDPGNAEWQRDLSVSYDRIGDVQGARGDLEGALTAYQDSHAIFEKLAAQDPGNAEWQRDLSVSFNKIGDVQRARGDLEGALTAYQDSLGIREKLAAQDPGNALWQRDLIVSRVKLAEVAEAQDGRGSEAARHYRAALDIAVALRDGGRLAPADAWMVADLEARLGRVSQVAAP